MSKISQILLKSKFRGCMLGSLIGDCFGAPFEGDVFGSGSKLVLQKYFDKLDGPYFAAPAKKFTEDSSMTKSTAQYLVDNPSKIEPSQLAKYLVKEYFNDTKRGYGENIVNVFHQLRFNKFADPFKPANEEGIRLTSNDNGAAVRVSPIALNYYDNFNTMMEKTKISSEITHSHAEGINGALLQCVTIQQSLTIHPDSELNVFEFVDQLINKMDKIEKDEEGLGIGDPSPFKSQLQIIKDLLKNKDIQDEQVIEQLGHSVRSLYSVPTAIFCFLKSCTEIKGIETKNPFRRTLQYAISLGGDTDSIASMAGSIAGAFYGEEKLSPSSVKHCEASDKFIELADKLYDLKNKT